MYKLLRDALFLLPAETSHHFALNSLKFARKVGALGASKALPGAPVEVMGIRFPNKVGLAAGLDKNGDYISAMSALGFGFIEIGTVTPIAQEGNPKQRLFRLESEQAIINRMGFNNKGLQHLIKNAKERNFDGVLGINIGKNKNTPEDKALSDYQICMDGVYPLADYITINMSSPNTPGLRDLQFGESFQKLLAGIKTKQAELHNQHRKYVPVIVKIAPDMNDDELKDIAQSLIEHNIDGVIATNTTVGREGVENSEFKDEAGGLSGNPVREKSTETIRKLSTYVDGQIPIIGVGGIACGRDAQEKIEAGASLVQIYSGFIYNGPKLIADASYAIRQGASASK